MVNSQVLCGINFWNKSLSCLYSFSEIMDASDRKSTCLERLVWPSMISIRDFDTPRRAARNLMHILLAALSTGAAVSFSLSASPCRPMIVFLDERGCTKTLKIIPSGCSRIDSIFLIFAFEFMLNDIEWILFLIRIKLDRIYRICWIFFSRLSGRKPENPIDFGEQ